jgi:hypothetical protein
MAAALCRTLADALDQVEDPAVDDSTRATVRDLAVRLEEAVSGGRAE